MTCTCVATTFSGPASSPKSRQTNLFTNASGRLYVIAMHDAMLDYSGLLQQLGLKGMPSWFVYCMQVLCARKTPAQKDAAVTHQTVTYAANTNNGAKPKAYYLLPILALSAGNWKSNVYGDIACKPIEFRGSMFEQEREANVVERACALGKDTAKPHLKGHSKRRRLLDNQRRLPGLLDNQRPGHRLVDHRHQAFANQPSLACLLSSQRLVKARVTERRGQRQGSASRRSGRCWFPLDFDRAESVVRLSLKLSVLSQSRLLLRTCFLLILPFALPVPPLNFVSTKCKFLGTHAAQCCRRHHVATLRPVTSD